MKKIIVVMPAYNAEKTLELTCKGMPKIYDEIVVCDDASKDQTYEHSKNLGLTSFKHQKNRGYGGNQKTLYDYALSQGADIIIMVHPDNQYKTDCLPEMVKKIEQGAEMVLGNRMSTALKNNMPLWKYISNRFLTIIENLVFRTHLSEFHSGLRAYNARAIAALPYKDFSEDFVFDSEMIASMIANGFSIDEVPTECYYNEHVSSINIKRSIRYGFETLKTLMRFMVGKYKIQLVTNEPSTR